jgi:hypothetical protein
MPSGSSAGDRLVGGTLVTVGTSGDGVALARDVDVANGVAVALGDGCPEPQATAVAIQTQQSTMDSVFMQRV